MFRFFGFSRERGGVASSDGTEKQKGGEQMSQKDVKESLLEQLKLQGKTADFYGDLVEDYMHYWKLKKDLIQDIKKRGIRYEAMNGNGIKVEKTNESVQNLQKTTAIMLKILSDLGLRDQISNESEADGYL